MVYTFVITRDVILIVLFFYILITVCVDRDLLKRMIELKRRLTDLTSRENKITYYENDSDCSDDSDMEEVRPSSADDLLVRCLATTVTTFAENNVII